MLTFCSPVEGILSHVHCGVSGRLILFVVNHHSAATPDESVEMFEFDESQLVLHHIKSIRDEAFTL